MSLTYQRKLQIFSSILAATVLVACGAQGNPGALPAVNLAQPLASSRTFHFTHGVQKFRVPQGVTQLTITAFGAQGGGLSGSKYVPPGALGAKISATFSVNGGALLDVYVGGKGIKGGSHGKSGGFNGGGGSFTGAYGGGGGSDVRTAGDKLTDRIIVAAGGGGSGASGEGSSYEGSYGSYYSLYGGPGGVGGTWNGATGGAGESGGEGGGGGYQTFGGAGGAGRSGSSQSFSYYYSCNAAYGSQGKLHGGGEGANGSCGPPGGGGGGGYYGGGGGGGGGYQGYTATGTISYYSGGGGGGGGGSSFVEKSATHRKTGQGRTGNGLVVIEW